MTFIYWWLSSGRGVTIVQPPINDSEALHQLCKSSHVLCRWYRLYQQGDCQLGGTAKAIKYWYKYPNASIAAKLYLWKKGDPRLDFISHHILLLQKLITLLNKSRKAIESKHRCWHWETSKKVSKQHLKLVWMLTTIVPHVSSRFAQKAGKKQLFPPHFNRLKTQQLATEPLPAAPSLWRGSASSQC